MRSRADKDYRNNNNNHDDTDTIDVGDDMK
jgi:hypothetical protein